MFIILVLILSFIAISLKLSASGLELGQKVVERTAKDKKSIEVARLGLATSITLMRVMAFIVSRVRDLLGLLGSFTVLLGGFILGVIIISSTSTIALFSDTDVDGSLVLNGITQQAFQESSGKLDAPVDVGGKPAGLSEESWSKADAVGKKIVSFASDTTINPPNGKYLFYKQGNTPVGYADCSVFVCGVLEGALNRTFAGGDAPNGYNFAVNRKSDLKGYVPTSSMRQIVSKKPQSNIGTTATSLDSALPGDILLKVGHVGIYVGKNENGEHVMVHASSSVNPKCKGDINLSDGQNLQVGFSRVSGKYDIIRPSILLGY